VTLCGNRGCDRTEGIGSFSHDGVNYNWCGTCMDAHRKGQSHERVNLARKLKRWASEEVNRWLHEVASQ